MAALQCASRDSATAAICARSAADSSGKGNGAKQTLWLYLEAPVPDDGITFDAAGMALEPMYERETVVAEKLELIQASRSVQGFAR